MVTYVSIKLKVQYSKSMILILPRSIFALSCVISDFAMNWKKTSSFLTNTLPVSICPRAKSVAI